MRSLLLSKPFAAACALCLACSILGGLLAGLPGLAVLGALVISLLLGMLCQAARPLVDFSAPGLGFISNKFLRAGIILLGFKLNLMALAQAGSKTIILACFVVAGTMLGVYGLARKLGVSKRLAILAASGTGICGAAAVMGVSSQIASTDKNAEELREDSVIAVAIVAILGTLFTLIEVTAAPLLDMTATQFGVLAGGSLHEIAHAVAAGGAGGPVALDIAIITKLSRVLLLAPIAIIVGIWYRKTEGSEEGAGQGGAVPIPWFMLGFVLASIAGSFLPLGENLIGALVRLSYLLLGMAMAALGASVNFRILVTRGRNAFMAALACSAALAACVFVAARMFF